VKSILISHYIDFWRQRQGKSGQAPEKIAADRPKRKVCGKKWEDLAAVRRDKTRRSAGQKQKRLCRIGAGSGTVKGV
jgi:hypothetical protein